MTYVIGGRRGSGDIVLNWLTAQKLRSAIRSSSFAYQYYGDEEIKKHAAEDRACESKRIGSSSRRKSADVDLLYRRASSS